MRIAGLIVFWVGLVAFWAVTVTMVVTKGGPANPSPEVTGGNGPEPPGKAEPKEKEKETEKEIAAVPEGADPPMSPEAIDPREATAVEEAKQANVVPKAKSKAAVAEKKKVTAPTQRPAVAKAEQPPTRLPTATSKPKETLAAKQKAAGAEPRAVKDAKVAAKSAAKKDQPPEQPPASVAKAMPPEKKSLAPSVAAVEKPTAKAAGTTTLVLRVPEDAKVYLAGRATRSTGSRREFATTQLPAGRVVARYPVRVEIQRDGRRIVAEQTISLRAGQYHEMTIFSPAASP